MSDKNDKTVPSNADDYKDDDRKPNAGQDPAEEHHPLVKEAKSKPGETPNRDEDEFSNDGLKRPDVNREAEREADKTTDNG